jgi:predicted phosphoribosyltransferase
MNMPFAAAELYHDRRHAGQLLARDVRTELAGAEALVLALPRGGVPVAHEIARALALPLDVFAVRTLFAPGLPSRPLGAIALGGYEVLDQPLIESVGLSHWDVAAIADRETEDLQRVHELLRGSRPAAEVHGRTIVLVDDALATSHALRVAVRSLADQGAARIIVAVGVGARHACAELGREAGAFICPLQPQPLSAASEWFGEYPPVTDAEIHECLGVVEPMRASTHPFAFA